MSNGNEKLFSGTATKDGIRDLLAGMAGGFICRIIEYPLDTIKVSCVRFVLWNTVPSHREFSSTHRREVRFYLLLTRLTNCPFYIAGSSADTWQCLSRSYGLSAANFPARRPLSLLQGIVCSACWFHYWMCSSIFYLRTGETTDGCRRKRGAWIMEVCVGCSEQRSTSNVVPYGNR